MLKKVKKIRNNLLLLTIALCCLTFVTTIPASGETHSNRRKTTGSAPTIATAAAPLPSITKNRKYAAIVVDTSRNLVLYKRNSRARRHPASLTKMMTLYILFDEIKKGKLNLNSPIYVSKNANKMPPSRLDIAAGDSLSVREAIYALTIKSANNISVAIAEKVARREAVFVEMMNRKARQLGMKDTNFVNPHGWHHPQQYTTAYDMVLLGIALQRDHPEKYKMFSKTSFQFRNKTINTHNRVLQNYHGTDGIKTGYIQPSGFNLVTSVKRPGKGSLVAVVMGGNTAGQRDQHMVALLDASYRLIDAKYPAKRPLNKPQSPRPHQQLAVKKRSLTNPW